MGELIVDFITSLDGYASAEGWPGWWGLEGPEYLRWLDERPEATLLMGANTYRLMLGFADGSTSAGIDEFSADEENTFGGLTGASKVVFSSTLEEPLSWANTTLVRADAVEAARAMKADGPGLLSTVRVPVETGHPIRLKPATQSGRNRPPNPEHSGHLFRLIPATTAG